VLARSASRVNGIEATACLDSKENDMERIHRKLSVGRLIPLICLASLGCAPLTAGLGVEPPHLEARGPGTVFRDVEGAAIDALIYAYLQAQTAHDGRMRGGTIHPTPGGYTYGEVVVAGGLDPNAIHYRLKPRDVARFHSYADPTFVDRRIPEEATPSDRRSVRFSDPLHRPLYVLHPSLVIRVYRGPKGELIDVADLRQPTRELLAAGQ